MRLKLLALIALVGGPAAAFMGFQEKQTLDRIKAEGVEVPGTMESGESTKRKGVTSYKFDIAWTTKDGKKMLKKSMSLPSSFVTPRLSGDTIARPEVTVRYLPSDPNEAFVVNAESDPKATMYGGAVIGVLGLAGTAAMFRKKQG